LALASAFAQAIAAGRLAYLGGAMAERESAEASPPVVGTPFLHHAD
jgi:thiazole synthase